jgi:LmbE family N-acetylglucosaminyl deacetylase
VTYLTRGEWGGDADEAERAATREMVARNCIKSPGGTATFLNEQDGRVTYNLDTRFAVVGELRRARPDVVLTWYPGDPHPDHRITSQLVQDAVFQASTQNLETDTRPVGRPDIYYFGKPRTSFKPTTFVDMSNYLDRKLDALYKHETEVERLQEQRGMDVSWAVQSRVAAYGQLSGVSLTEGFIAAQHSASAFLG